jgi:hypothetical protein
MYAHADIVINQRTAHRWGGASAGRKAPMRSRHVLGWVIVSALLATGCSGDDDDDGAASTGVTGGEPAATTEPADSTKSIPDVASTAPSSPPTTQATTTTSLPIEEQVRAAMLGYYDFYWRCLRAPNACDPLEVAVPDSDAFNALTATKNDLVGNGYFVGPEDVGYMVITSIEPMDDHTLVTTCWWSTAVLYFQPPDPNAPPTVQNNTPSSGIEAYQFVQLPDLSWKVRRGDPVGEQSTENQCPPPD